MRFLVAVMLNLMFFQVGAQVFFFVNDEIKTLRDTINITNLSGKFNFTFDDETTCDCTFYRGRLHGQWYCRYKNGSAKVKGSFAYGQLTGRWIFRSSDGRQKARVRFENTGTYRLRYVRQGLLSFPVLLGRGKLSYTLGDKYTEVQYRKGKKEGVQLTSNAKGEEIEMLNFNNGLYHGSFHSTMQDRYVWKGQYDHGVPVGDWIKLDKRLGRSEMVSFSQTPYVAVGERPYVAPFDKIWEQYRLHVVTDNFNENFQLFQPDSSGFTLLNVLEDAFIHNKTVFYEDVHLEKPYVYSIQKQTLTSCIPERVDTIFPFALLFIEYVYFSKQTFNLQNMILHCSMLITCKKNDSTFVVSTPLLYFPQSYRELTKDRVYGKYVKYHFDRLLNGDYIVLPLGQFDRETLYETGKRDMPDVHSILFYQADVMNTMQNFMMIHLGLRNDFFSSLQE